MKLLFVFVCEESAAPLLDELRRKEIDLLWKRVETSEAMLKALAGGQWDAVLFEDAMAGLGVAEALDVMEENGRGVPFIVITEKGGMEPFVSLVKRGVSDFVVKDDLKSLAPTIERELRCSRLRREISRNEEEIRRLANYDSMTNLPNRRLLIERLTHGIKRAKRQKYLCSVLFLDLDNFKSVNDEFGHHRGDALLQETAQRLQSCIRESDTAARTGGDEFIIVLEDVDNENRGARVADNILDALRRPFILGDDEAVVSASIGIAVYPFDGDDAKTLLVRADVAMYQVKNEGRNGFKMFKPGMEAKNPRFRQNDRETASGDAGKAVLPLSWMRSKSRIIRALALHTGVLMFFAAGIFFMLWSNPSGMKIANEKMLDFDPNMATSAGGGGITCKKL